MNPLDTELTKFMHTQYPEQEPVNDMERTYIDKAERLGDIIQIDGKKVCMATHPINSTTDTRAKGRSMHLSADGKKTVCNMKFQEVLHANNFPRKECKICFKQYLIGK